MRALSLVALVLLAGCSGIRPHPPPAADPGLLRARLGQAPCVAAALLVKILPRQGEGELFTLKLWAAPDGRVRVLAHKLDVDFLSALVEADGAYTALLPRAGVWTRGRLGGAGDPVMLRDLALLVAEVRSGPLPAGPATATPDGWRLRDPATGWDAAITLDRSSGLPAAKRLLGSDGSEQRRIDYANWQGFENLLRPSAVTLHVAGDDATYAIRLKSLDAPPEISAERMALRLPAGAGEVTAEEFARRVAE